MTSIGEIVFESSDLGVRFLEGGTDVLLITFSPMGLNFESGTFWGEDFGKKTNTAMLGFTCVGGPKWYPASVMNQAISACRDILLRHAFRVTYGASMGAYAALKFSNAFNASAAISFSPQYSINPTDIPDEENSFRRYYLPELHSNMAIQPSDICANSYIFFDPWFHADKWNADKIRRIAPHIHEEHLYLLGHETPRAFAGTPSLQKMLSLSLSRDFRALRLFAIEKRRGGGHRIVGILDALMQKKTHLALNLFLKYSEIISPRSKPGIIFRLVEALLNENDLEAAMKLNLEGRALFPNDQRLKDQETVIINRTISKDKTTA